FSSPQRVIRSVKKTLRLASLYGVDRDVVELTLVTLTRYFLEFSSPQRVIRSVKKTLRLASLYGVDRDKQKTGIP
ncbi:hypothetical protein ACM6Q7_00640, partial [Peribacillus butanolivorans]|uniref:hypothetical protein n=1 Tax=Peribacillus butanolivorans TaxID=421767 RepID=UPI0039FD6318